MFRTSFIVLTLCVVAFSAKITPFNKDVCEIAPNRVITWSYKLESTKDDFSKNDIINGENL